MTAEEVSDLPDPDSPMRPTRSPGAISKESGCTSSRWCVEIVRSLTRSSGDVAISSALSVSDRVGRAGRRPSG